MSNINPLYHLCEDKLQSELEWIQRAKTNPKHFGYIYNKYNEQIFRYIYQRMSNKDHAFDVTAQVFLKALKNLKKYEYRGVPFGSWLYRIAKSELNQAFRNNAATRTISLETTHIATFMEVFKEEENELNRKKLTKALSQLKEEDVQLIEMRYFEDRPYKEIGEILFITENNAKVKTYRALERLKKYFKQI